MDVTVAETLKDLTVLLACKPEERDEAWERNFLHALPKAKVRVLSPEAVSGPDHWPYLTVTIVDSPVSQSVECEPITNVLQWLSTRGIGLVVNAEKSEPDYVFTYGMVWNFRERGEFFTDVGQQVTTGKMSAEKFSIGDGEKFWVGPPSEGYFPSYARSVLKRFFADQGVFGVKILMLSSDQINYDLAFSLESLRSPPQHEHANIAEAIAWFLPGHYSLTLVSEKVISGFVAL